MIANKHACKHECKDAYVRVLVRMHADTALPCVRGLAKTAAKQVRYVRHVGHASFARMCKPSDAVCWGTCLSNTNTNTKTDKDTNLGTRGAPQLEHPTCTTIRTPNMLVA
eukprot:364357-Chlamydomonas_euryale.AAC.2